MPSTTLEAITDTKPKGAPKLLVAALVVLAASLVLMWNHGFPRTTSDAICFQQPAYMRMHAGLFSLPTFRGQSAPYLETIYSYPTPVYTLFSFSVFKIFGFGLFTSLAADLTVHLLFVAIVAWGCWKLTGNPLIAAMVVLATAHLFDPIGRPEELGLLFALTAFLLVAREQPRYWLIIVSLGLCGATAAGTAIAATCQVLFYLALQRGMGRNFWGIAGLIAVVAPAISVVIYFWTVHPYSSEAVEQLLYATSNYIYREPVELLLSRDPLWGSFFVGILTTATLSTGCWLANRPTWLSANERVRRVVLALAIGAAVSLTFSFYMGRPRYDFRFAAANCIGITALTLNSLMAHSRSHGRTWAIAGLAGFLVLGVLPNREYGRYLLASLTWKSDAVTYTESVATIHKVVPRDASVGGDSAVWTCVTDGRPFFAIRWVTLDNWPEYIVSTQWTKVPYVFQEPKWRKKIEESYVEVTPQKVPPVEACGCQVGGWTIPLATGRCDWDVRIWKRRETATN